MHCIVSSYFSGAGGCSSVSFALFVLFVKVSCKGKNFIGQSLEVLLDSRLKIEFPKDTIYFPIAVIYFLLTWKHISEFTYSIFDETASWPGGI